MIWNIVDHRTRPYRWKRINAIVEAIWHDNSCENSDQAEEVPEEIVYDKREGISLADAIAWASGLPDRVTLYLYDEGVDDCSKKDDPRLPRRLGSLTTRSRLWVNRDRAISAIRLLPLRLPTSYKKREGP